MSGLDNNLLNDRGKFKIQSSIRAGNSNLRSNRSSDENCPRGGVTVSFDKKQAATMGCVDWTTNFMEDSHSTFTP